MFSLLAAFLMLPLILLASLRSTKVQTYLVGHLTEYLSRELGTELSVGGVDIRLLRSIVLVDVKMKDRQGKPLLEVQRMEVELGKMSFNQRRLSINELHFEDAFLNVYKEINNDSYNFGFLIEYFSGGERTGSTGARWEVICAAFRLTNTSFYHRDKNIQPREYGFDPGNFYVNDFNLAMDDILLQDSTLSFQLDYMFYKESSGFLLSDLSGHFSIGPHQTSIDHFNFRSETSDLLLDLTARYESFTSVEAFLSSLDYHLNIQASQLDLADMGYFFPRLYGIKEILRVQGEFEGGNGNLSANEVMLEYGEHSKFHGGFHLTGMFDWPQSSLDFRVDKLRSSMEDITSIQLPANWERQTLQPPGYLFNLGEFSFSGGLNGSLTDLMAEGSMDTDIGQLNADIKLHKDPGDALYHYQGTLGMDQFHMGKLFENNGLGNIDMKGDISGSGFCPETLDLNIDGHVASFDVLGNLYENIQLSGDFLHRKFNGSFLVDDPNLFLDFRGMVDFEQAVPLFDFVANIDRANLTKMNVFQRDTLYDSTLSAYLKINAHGSSLDDLDGVIILSDIQYAEASLFGGDPFNDPPAYSTDSIYLRNTLWSKDNKHLRFRSDFLDADLYGKIHFDQLANALRQTANAYIPALNLKNNRQKETDEHTQEIEFSFRFKDTEDLTRLFFPTVRISPDSWLNGSFGSLGQNIVVQAHASHLSLFGRRFIDWNLSGNHTDDHYELSVNSSKLMLSDSLHMNDFAMKTIWDKDEVSLSLLWNGKEYPGDNGGNIQGVARIHDKNYFDFSFQTSHAWLNGDRWELNLDNKIIVDTNRVEIFNLMVSHRDQFLMAEGVLSDDPEDKMGLSFANFEVAYTDLLMGESDFDFGGRINGYVSFTGLYQPLSIGAEIHVEGFSFNHEVMGDLTLQSIWNNDQQAFLVNGAIADEKNGEPERPVSVDGKIYTGDRDHNFDLDIDVVGKTMSVWGRYMQNFAEDVKGIATGRLRLDGPFSSPELTGLVSLSDASLHIPYLNVTYHFEHDVEFTKNSFRFADDVLLLKDSLGNTAEVTGAILHDVFSDFALDIVVRPEETIIFNTSAADNPMYYGTAFLTGQAHFHGPTNDIIMDVSARTNRGTRVSLPLNYTGEVRESHFISFVSREKKEDGPTFVVPDLPGAVTLNFDLEVTPDAEVQLFFDARFGDILRGTGNGNLRLEVSPEGSFNIYGDFVIAEGEYLFNLQNIINKRFRIEQGSTIGWTGDLNDADIDLRAAYRLRTNLYDLFVGEGFDPATADIYRRRIPLETILMLEDKLFDPTISFDITVPGGDEQTREMIERVITTDQEMNRQVFSLLVLNRFVPTTADQYNTALGYGVGSTSSELLSNQLSNWLSQISSDFDIGINYRPGDEISSQELELALSTQLFDDRVMIDGNFGVAGNQTATGHRAQGANQIIGDVNVEVMITPEGKFRVKAFNRSNTFDIINTNAPYTQGIGLFYRKEFDRLEELFRREQRPEADE